MNNFLGVMPFNASKTPPNSVNVVRERRLDGVVMSMYLILTQSGR